MTTGKSRHRREVIIPLCDALRSVLASIPKRATTILTNSRCPALESEWLRHSIQPGQDRRWHGRQGLTHDLRGTAATRFYIAGLSERVIAEIMGWEEEYVAKIIRRYVGRAAATKAIIHQLNRAEKRT